MLPPWMPRATASPVTPTRATWPLVAAGCSSSNNTATGTTPVSGGTATWAEQPSALPNYIFPFTSSEFISVSNLNDFGFMLYRPLYWFGTGAKPTLNTLLSLAYPATFSGTVHGVSNKQITIETSEGNLLDFDINRKTKIMRGKKQIAASDLDTGDTVTIDAREEMGKFLIALVITAQPKN